VYVSLKDVAARAGVSFQTAGKVLNGRPVVVADTTRERIRAAAAELGYVPNVIARSLITQTTCTIGIVADDLDDWALARFVVGAEREARRRGHAVLITTVASARGASAREAPARARNSDAEGLVRALIERRVDGILAAAPQLEHDERVAELLAGRVPAVSLHHVPGGRVPVVGSNHFRTGQLATGHLARLGHRRIATVTGPPRRLVVASRLRGYRSVLQASGLPADPHLVEEADWTAASGHAAAGRLLDRDPSITAIFAHSDLIAVGVLSALHERGRRVPEDCAVVGCDDLPLVAHTIPPLTTVHVPFYETGERAVALLLDRIAGRDPASARVLLPVELVVRGSCGAGRPAAPTE
jgi:LacI family transcriptional regulator